MTNDNGNSMLRRRQLKPSKKSDSVFGTSLTVFAGYLTPGTAASENWKSNWSA